MISPRGFYYNRQRPAATTSTTTTAGATDDKSANNTTKTKTATNATVHNPSSSPPTKSTTVQDVAVRKARYAPTSPAAASTRANAIASVATRRSGAAPVVSVAQVKQDDGMGGKRKTQPQQVVRRESLSRTRPLAVSPQKTTTGVTVQPTMPSSPVEIPSKSRSHSQRRYHHNHHQRRPQRPKDVHAPDAIPASVVALLAITDIPRPAPSSSPQSTTSATQRPHRRSRISSRASQRMTVNAIIEGQQVSEKALSLSLVGDVDGGEEELARGRRDTLDFLLSPPNQDDDENPLNTEDMLDSVLSTTVTSLNSTPSLCGSLSTETLSSMETPPEGALGSPGRRSRLQPVRLEPEPLLSPPGEPLEHPLAKPTVDVEDMDFRVFDAPDSSLEKKAEKEFGAFRPFRSAFKSNLTASLRVLKSAAKTFSSLNLTSIPPDDFLTRSILTMDPRVPYTDERRPPPLKDEPSPALRRYLNPTTNALIEPRPITRSYTASIQMQTYKIERSSRTLPTPPGSPTPSSQPSGSSSSSEHHVVAVAVAAPQALPTRPREMRENCDFIRIAVMEMAMRRSGKLDDQRPGRARWALPPRKTSSRPYEVRADGVPARWVPVAH